MALLLCALSIISPTLHKNIISPTLHKNFISFGRWGNSSSEGINNQPSVAGYGIETRANSTFHGCLITVDVQFAKLVKMVSDRLLHSEVIINKYFIGRYYETIWVYFSLPNNVFNYFYLFGLITSYFIQWVTIYCCNIILMLKFCLIWWVGTSFRFTSIYFWHVLFWPLPLFLTQQHILDSFVFSVPQPCNPFHQGAIVSFIVK